MTTYVNALAVGYPFKEFFLWEPYFWLRENGGYFGVSVLFVLLFGIIIYFITNIMTSLLIESLITFIIGTVNHFLVAFRNEYFTIGHIGTIGEARQLQLEISLKDIVILLIVFVAQITTIIAIYYIYKRKNVICRKYIGYIGLGLYCVMLLSASLYQYEDKIFGKIKQEQQGGVVVFAESIFDGVASKVYMRGLNDILTQVERDFTPDEIDADTNRANIIVIMSEAFWDMSEVVSRIQIDENPYAEFEKIKNESLSGKVAVNVYGGNTVTSEFEFLTGLNISKLQNAGARYYNSMKKTDNTFVSYLNCLGYDSVAIHPYDGEFWNRNVAYSQMGFDRFVDRDEFCYYENYNEFMSDDAFVKQIIHEYETGKNNNKPEFIFGVSIMNHTVGLVHEMTGEDVYKNELNVGISVGDNGKTNAKNNNELSDIEKLEESTSKYLNGIKLTCESFEYLMNYLKQQDEETLVVIFGDHAPHFAKDLYTYLGINEGDFYKTPYLIWSNKGKKNYEMTTADVKINREFNLSYLSSVLVDYLGYEKPKMVKFNLDMIKNAPIDTVYENDKVEDFNKIGEFGVDEFETKYFKWCIENENADNWKVNK